MTWQNIAAIAGAITLTGVTATIGAVSGLASVWLHIRRWRRDNEDRNPIVTVDQIDATFALPEDVVAIRVTLRSVRAMGYTAKSITATAPKGCTLTSLPMGKKNMADGGAPWDPPDWRFNPDAAFTQTLDLNIKVEPAGKKRVTYEGEIGDTHHEDILLRMCSRCRAMRSTSWLPRLRFWTVNSRSEDTRTTDQHRSTVCFMVRVIDQRAQVTTHRASAEITISPSAKVSA